MTATAAHRSLNPTSPCAPRSDNGNLSGNVDPLSGLTQMYYLDLSSNKFTGDLQLGSLTALQYL